MLSYQQTKPTTTLFFICKTFYILCLLSEVDVENNSCDKTYTVTTLSKEDHKSVLSFLVYLPRTMIVIYRLCTGFLNSTRIHTNNVTWICNMYHQTHLKTFNFYTHSCQRGSAFLPQHLLLL